MNIGIYARVSTDTQAEQGYSIGTQIEACERKALELGAKHLVRYVDDGYSGADMDRPELDKLRADLKMRLLRAVICYDPDRLARNLSHQLIIADEIEKAGAQLVFVSTNFETTPDGRLFFSIRGAISEFEKEKIRERSVRGKQGKAAKGKIIQNSKPFGFDWDPINSLYVINEEEAKTVRLIYTLCIEHQMSVNKIYQELKRLGLKGKAGKFMHPKTIHNILTKKMYCGRYEQFREVTKKIGQKSREIRKNDEDNQVIIDIPAIVTPETFQAAQEQLAQNRILAPRNTKAEYLLRGVLFCPDCGLRLVGSQFIGHRKRKPDKLYQYYYCVSKISAAYRLTTWCPALRIPAQDLDAAVWELLTDLAKGNRQLEEFIERQQDLPGLEQELARLTSEKADLEKKKVTLVRWFREGVVDGPDAEKDLRDINRELQRITWAIAGLANRQPESKTLPVDDILRASTFDQRRNVVTSLGFKFHARKDRNDVVDFWFE